MNIEEFQRNFGIKSRKKIEKWIGKGLIPGIKTDRNGKWIIPKEALPPYTRARARSAPGIYLSLLKGVCSNRQVLPQLYNVSENLFDAYMEILIKAGYIKKKTVNGINYYLPLPKAEQYIEENTGVSKLVKILAPWIQAGTIGCIKGLKE